MKTNGIDTNSLRHRALVRLVQHGQPWSCWRLAVWLDLLNMPRGLQQIIALAIQDPWFKFYPPPPHESGVSKIGLSRAGLDAAKAAGLLCLAPKAPEPEAVWPLRPMAQAEVDAPVVRFAGAEPMEE